MKITRAVITAAAPHQSTLPLQRLVDRDGQEKTAVQMIVEEALDAQIEKVCIIIAPGRRASFEQAVGPHRERVTFLEQDQPRGYGDALLRAAGFVNGEAFLHLVGDHLYLSRSEHRCARQLVEVARQENCSVSAVQATREQMLPHFGAIGGTPVAKRTDLYAISNVLEKPTPTQAEQHLIVAGLRSGYYLCFFGMHVLTPAVLDLLTAARQAAPDEMLGLSPSLAALNRRERHLALEVAGSRYNIGIPYGLLVAQLALALSGKDREQILTELVELLATR